MYRNIVIVLVIVLTICDAAPATAAPAAPSRILFLGNSITRHGPLDTHRGLWGMAATEPDLDYVHRLQLRLAANTGIVPEIRIAACNINWCLPEYLEPIMQDFAPDLVIVQTGDNSTGLDQVGYMDRLQSILDTMPGDATVIVTGVWYSQQRESWNETLAVRNGMDFAPIFDLNVADNRQYLNCAPDDAICSHPGDRGHAAIADRIYDAWTAKSNRTSAPIYLPMIRASSA